MKTFKSIFQESFNVTLDMSNGSAYQYRHDSKIPTTIRFNRRFDGRLQKGKIEHYLTNQELHNVMYLLKRGYEIETIYDYMATNCS